MVKVHEKPSTRETWEPHVSEAWYLGPIIYHYQCYRLWVWKTRAEHASKTLAWLPNNVIMYIPGSNDRAIAAATGLVAALKKPFPATVIAPINDNNLSTLEQLHKVLQDHTETKRNDARSTARLPPTTEGGCATSEGGSTTAKYATDISTSSKGEHDILLRGWT